jgi:acyl-CoA reductase-like NAD-dependent aldehyde dehydrogenase
LVEAKSGERIDAINPSNYSLVGSAPAGDKIDVDLAVAAARRTFEAGDWQGMLPMTRTKILLAAADLIKKHAEEITHLEVLDNGMPLGMAQRLVSTGAETFRYFAGWCTKIYGNTTNISAPGEYHV